MPRKFLRRWLPTDETMREHKHLRWMGRLLHDPNLWHLNRRSVAGAVSVGFFLAWVPVPIQMWIAALVAVVIRVNLPIAVMGVWMTNPITVAPMFLFAANLGAWILGRELTIGEFRFSWSWLTEQTDTFWEPLLLGCFVIGLTAAVGGNLLVRLVWRLHVLRHWQERRRRRLNPPVRPPFRN